MLSSYYCAQKADKKYSVIANDSLAKWKLSLKVCFPQYLQVTLRSFLILAKFYTPAHKRLKQKEGYKSTNFLQSCTLRILSEDWQFWSNCNNPKLGWRKFFFQLASISTTQNASQISFQAVLKLVVSSLNPMNPHNEAILRTSRISPWTEKLMRF